MNNDKGEPSDGINDSSGSRNLSERGPNDSRNLWPHVAAIFYLTSFNRGGGRASGHPLDSLLNEARVQYCFYSEHAHR